MAGFFRHYSFVVAPREHCSISLSRPKNPQYSRARGRSRGAAFLGRVTGDTARHGALGRPTLEKEEAKEKDHVGKLDHAIGVGVRGISARRRRPLEEELFQYPDRIAKICLGIAVRVSRDESTDVARNKCDVEERFGHGAVDPGPRQSGGKERGVVVVSRTSYRSKAVLKADLTRDTTGGGDRVGRYEIDAQQRCHALRIEKNIGRTEAQRAS